jgi:hypothetical protein
MRLHGSEGPSGEPNALGRAATRLEDRELLTGKRRRAVKPAATMNLRRVPTVPIE